MPNGNPKKNQKRLTSPLRARVVENLNLILVAFALAFVTWIFAKMGESEEVGLTIPVVPMPSDPRVEVKVMPSSLPVVLRYPKDLRNYISSENFMFVVDISDLREKLGLEWKAKTEPMNEKNLVANIRGARRVTLVKVGAPSNTVRVEARWNAIPAIVEPDLTGLDRIPSGYQLLTPVRVIPREAWVTGDPQALATLPRDELTSKVRLLTEKVSVADRTQGGLVTVPIRLPQGVEIVQPPTTTAEIALEIQEIQTVREIRGVKLDFSAVAPESLELVYDVKTATVTVFGPQSLLPKVTPEMIEVTFVRPTEELPNTTKEVALEAHFAATAPEEIRSKLTIRSIEPRTIKITYLPRQR
jgi:hypothetical protein